MDISIRLCTEEWVLKKLFLFIDSLLGKKKISRDRDLSDDTVIYPFIAHKRKQTKMPDYLGKDQRKTKDEEKEDKPIQG